MASAGERLAMPALTTPASEAFLALIRECWDPLPANRPTAQAVLSVRALLNCYFTLMLTLLSKFNSTHTNTNIDMHVPAAHGARGGFARCGGFGRRGGGGGR
jgi:hypothetical protein